MSEPTTGAAAPKHPLKTTGSIEVRVRYCECDPMGVAHHASYAPWLEMGRTEILRESGVTYAQLEQAGVFLVVASLEMKFRRPCHYDDLIEVQTRIAGGSRVKIVHHYALVLREDGLHGGTRSARTIGDVLAIATTTLACVGKDGRIQPLPDWLIAEEQR